MMTQRHYQRVAPWGHPYCPPAASSFTGRRILGIAMNKHKSSQITIALLLQSVVCMVISLIVGSQLWAFLGLVSLLSVPTAGLYWAWMRAHGPSAGRLHSFAPQAFPIPILSPDSIDARTTALGQRALRAWDSRRKAVYAPVQKLVCAAPALATSLARRVTSRARSRSGGGGRRPASRPAASSSDGGGGPGSEPDPERCSENLPHPGCFGGVA